MLPSSTVETESAGLFVSLLRDIEASIIDPDSDLSSVLLKLRLLASRLGSRPLEEWVKHEAEGYPQGIEIPEYRNLSASFIGTWSDGLGATMQNMPIPPYLVEQYADKAWLNQEMRQSIAAVDALLSGDDNKAGMLQGEAENLVLLLQGKVYPNMHCHSVVSQISKTQVREIQNTVRHRILELIIELEKEVPAAAEVTLGAPQPDAASASDTVTQIFNQTIQGPFTNVTSTGANARLNLTITQGDKEAMIGELVKAGIPQDAATEFTKVVASEEPGSAEQPLGKHAGDWWEHNIRKAADGTWKIGAAVATSLLEEAALRYWGLK